jgi:anaerobic magnesium-protoporphyrin IX monomethyl ester cyclase
MEDMRFSRVLLISPPSSSRYGGLRVPAGIGYVAQALYDENIPYSYLDMRIGHSFDQLVKRIENFRPELLGVSMITLEYKKTYALLNRIKQLHPDLPILVGGHHLTILKEQVLQDCPSIDFGIVSDGEIPLIELCKGKMDIPSIKSLIYRENGEIVFNGTAPVVEDLDRYNFPHYHGFNLKDYSKQIPILSSRGCVYQCTFCPNKLLGSKFRMRSPEHFVDEIEWWYKKGYYQFAFDDDNFALNKNRVYSICDEIEKRSMSNKLFIRCSNGIRADSVDRDMLLRLKEIGVREVGFGVDGGNNKVLKNLKKGETIETIERAIQTACEVGLDVKIFIIVGTPGETMEDIEDSIALALRYPIARVNFNNAIPYPGTEMFDYVKQNDLFLIPPEEYLNNITEERPFPVFETPEFRKEDRVRMLERCHRIEEQVMRDTAARMFSRLPLIARFLRKRFNVLLFERLFFHNLILRKLFEWLRYRMLLAR